MVIISIFGNKVSKIYYIPHFGLFLYGFIRQKGKHYPRSLFLYLVFITSVDLLFIYCRYFFSLLVDDINVGYHVNTVISKYCLVFISVVFNQATVAL